MNRELLYSFQAIAIAATLVGVTGSQTGHAGSAPNALATPQCFLADGGPARQQVVGTDARSQASETSAHSFQVEPADCWARTSNIPDRGGLKLTFFTSSIRGGEGAAEDEAKGTSVLSSQMALPQDKSNHFVSSEENELTQKGDPDRGGKIYLADCSMCHQPNRAGIPPQIPSLIGVVDRLGDEKVRSVSKIGIPDKSPPMPPHPDLTEANIEDLIAFLRAK